MPHAGVCVPFLRTIFPPAVFGSSVTNTTSCGTLNGSRCLMACAPQEWAAESDGPIASRLCFLVRLTFPDTRRIIR